jgi:PEP-CTERM motif
MRSLFATFATAASLLCVSAQAQQVLLAVDTGANRVLTLNPTTGAVINSTFITDANSAVSYDFQTPRAAIQVNNEIWVSDQSPSINAIYRFDLNGAYVGKIGGSTGGLNNVRGMRFIDGTVYVVNAGTGNGAPGIGISRYDPSGSFQGFFTTTATVGSITVGNSPWDIAPYNGKLMVSDGTSRGLQLYNTDGSHAGAFSAAINNIPAEIFVRSNGNVLLAANGSTPTGSFGLYELNSSGALVSSWTGTPGLGVRGVFELGNGKYLINEAGGASAVRGLGTIDPAGVANSTNFTLIQGNINGGWISAANLTPVPEPATLALWLVGAGLLAAVRGRHQKACTRLVRATPPAVGTG